MCLDVLSCWSLHVLGYKRNLPVIVTVVPTFAIFAVSSYGCKLSSMFVVFVALVVTVS